MQCLVFPCNGSFIHGVLPLPTEYEDYTPISSAELTFDSNITTPQCVDIEILVDTDQTEGTEVFSVEIPFIDVRGDQESDELVPPVNVSILDLGRPLHAHTHTHTAIVSPANGMVLGSCSLHILLARFPNTTNYLCWKPKFV